MKNIHVLPTDKPSRIYTCGTALYINKVALEHDTNQNIYITSDEEIKEGDWYYNSFLNEISKMDILDYSNFRQKIILTTDQDLIKDGVQAIDNDFLEWFVKNPSCEEVEIEDVRYDISTLTSDVKKYPNLDVPDYKIIISKQEAKQEKLSEAIDSYIYKNSTELNLPDILTNAIMFGAKFQNEQILDFLHSEITERRNYSASKMCEKIIEFIENK